MTSLEECTPTFIRLAKLYWSMFWRCMLIIFAFAPIGAFLFYLSPLLKLEHSINLFGPFSIDFKSVFVDPSTALSFIIAQTTLYIVQCVLFRLVIDNQYSDFSLKFVPALDHKASGFWSTIFYVSWCYHWRVMIVTIIFEFFEGSLDKAHDPIISYLSFPLMVIIDTWLLRFVVNQNYKKVRLSLVKSKNDK